jgi:HD-GYP domain-containing protein (c-di-GMP phosphodiesterase class II)
LRFDFLHSIISRVSGRRVKFNQQGILQLVERSTISEAFEDLLNVGIALSSIHDLQRLLEFILTEARRLTQADAGTLYLVHENKLVFRVSQCRSLTERLGEPVMRQHYESFEMPISPASIAGYSALNREVLNIPDVNCIPEGSPYHYNPSWDQRTGYETHSMMVVPMLNKDRKIVGVLQLINSLGNDKIIPFSSSYEKVATSLASQAAVSIENATLAQELQQAHLDTIFRLGVAAEYRDKETANHIKRMSYFSTLIAESLGWPAKEVETLFWSSLMHDVGKLGTPDAILQKPGPLTRDERQVMEYHTIIGASILKGSGAKVLKQAQLVALTHHERFNGQGYPRGLQGEQIPIEGRITILADIFDALASRRVYKEALPEREVLRTIEEGRGTYFDPRLLDLFFDRLDDVREIQKRYADQPEDFDPFRNLDRLAAEGI